MTQDLTQINAKLTQIQSQLRYSIEQGWLMLDLLTDMAEAGVEEATLAAVAAKVRNDTAKLKAAVVAVTAPTAGS